MAIAAKKEPTSIIGKVSNLGATATLVIGRGGAGKSTTVRDTLIKRLENKEDARVLWIAFNNTGALVPDLDADDEATLAAKAKTVGWDAALIDKWNDFDTAVVKPAVAGDFKGKYDAFVWDGANITMAMIMSTIVTGDAAPSQPEWLKGSEKLRNTFISLRDKFPMIFVTADVVPGKDGADEVDLNRHSLNLLTPLFGHKWYVHTITERNASGQPSGKLYRVQKDPEQALKLKGLKE